MSFGNCTTRSRCGNAHTCDFCAKERQRKLADQAETLERLHGQLTLTVLCPDQNTAEAIGLLRASFLRRACAPAGIWTVETGTQFNGLHLNILSPRPAPARWKNCHTYSELVQTTAREAAAYIAKRSGMPQVEQYAGRLHGTFGQLFTYLAENKAVPVVQAAALEVTLSGGKKAMPANPTEKPKSTPSTHPQDWYEDKAAYNPNKAGSYYPDDLAGSNPPWRRREKSLEERREIMRKNLPNLYAALGKTNQPQQRIDHSTSSEATWSEADQRYIEPY